MTSRQFPYQVEYSDKRGVIPRYDAICVLTAPNIKKAREAIAETLPKGMKAKVTRMHNIRFHIENQ